MGGMGDDRMWRFRRRWSRPVLESVAASEVAFGAWKSYLCAAITRKRVVPKTLVWASQWLLVVVVVTMCSNSCSEAQDRWSEPHLVDNVLAVRKTKSCRCKIKPERRGKSAVNSCFKLTRLLYQLCVDQLALGKLELCKQLPELPLSMMMLLCTYGTELPPIS